MAEATVSRQPVTNYFCHTCNVRIGRVREDFTCPTCGGGFVEEVSNTPQHHGGGGNPIQDSISSLLGGGGRGSSPFDMLFRSLTEGMRSQGPGRGGRQGQTAGGGSNFVEVHQNPGGTFTVSVGGGGAGGGHEDEGMINPMEHMLNSFLNDLVVGLGGQQGPGPGATNMFGNLGDYVWGRDGLDAIVTQLMNQMEGTGAPPLATEKMDRLPTVKVNQEQVDKKLQCSVCWDDFQLDEEVKRLDCDHLYHPPCIIPWLQLHGTCPICRRDFTEGEGKGKDEQEERIDSNLSQSSGTPFQSNVIPQPQGSPSTSAATSNPTNTPGNNDGNAGSSSSTTGRNRNPRYNMDMEFD